MVVSWKRHGRAIAELEAKGSRSLYIPSEAGVYRVRIITLVSGRPNQRQLSNDEGLPPVSESQDHGRPAQSAQARIDQLSVVLDQVRDIISGATESIEGSQSEIGRYHTAILGEGHGVRVYGDSSSEEEDDNHSVIEVSSGDGSSGRGDLHEHRAMGKRPSRDVRSSRPANQRQAAGVQPVESDLRARERTERSAGNDETDSLESDSSVSSAGLTNTSDECTT